ncbi:MAG: GNAT family N-acetyltransferase [Candidatus Nanopelagicaceae bacterium]|nr:GNAT family N-acetyltransferase [Candidatus Nanopelagicaceae bacterium]
MKVSLLRSAPEFLVQTQALRAADPFRTNIIGSVTLSVANGSRAYEKCFWWTITSEDGKVIGAAMRTAPHGMIFTPMPKEALRELAQLVSQYDIDLPEIGGPSDVVSEFLVAYRDTGTIQSKRLIKESGHELLYTLRNLSVPSVPGRMEKATRDDYKKIYAWYVEFVNEAGLLMRNLEESIEDGLNRGSLRFWRVGNEIVSMAGHAPLVVTPSGTVGRIGPVYTPQMHRRHGYAGVLTAKLSQELIDHGARVMLFTDAKNPTSNSVYQKIGYELIDEIKKFKFVESGC